MRSTPDAGRIQSRPDARLIDLFAGPGGLDVAAHWLGIPAIGIEWDDNAVATRRAADLETRHGDVRDFGPHGFGDATVLAGGPPCQTFTVAGTGSGRRALDEVLRLVKELSAGQDITATLSSLSDERTGLVLEPLRWALAAHAEGTPYDAIVLEQVPAVLPVWKAMEEALRTLGYRTWSDVLRAEEFGVPQTRRRAVLVASAHHQPRAPKGTHAQFRRAIQPLRSRPDRRPWVSMGQALTLDPTSTRESPFEVISNYGSGGDPKARGRRLSSQPSATITGKVTRNRVVNEHGSELPRLSFREAGLLQTFPWDYPWSGNDVAQQIGNAVPPRLAVHVLAEALEIEFDAILLDKVVGMSWTESAGALRGPY